MSGAFGVRVYGRDPCRAVFSFVTPQIGRRSARAWLDIRRMAGACPTAGTGQRATSPEMDIEVNGYSRGGWRLRIFSAHATRALRRASLDVRSGRSLRSPLFIEETARALRRISAWRKASLLHIYLSEAAGLSGTGGRHVPVPMTVLIGIELIINSTEEDGIC